MAAKEKQNIIAELTTLPPGYVSTWYKRHCMAAITPVQSESSWAFLPSCTANKSCSDGWQEDKSTHKSTTKVGFTTKIIHFVSTAATTMVQCKLL